MTYRFHLPLDRAERPFFLERRMLEWLNDIDNRHDYDYQVHELNHIGGFLKDEIPRDSEHWNAIWANKHEGVYDKCTTTSTPSWRHVTHNQIECRDIGARDELGHVVWLNTYSNEGTYFEIDDDMLAIQFRFIFEVKSENE